MELTASLAPIDYGIIAVYVLFSIALGVWLGRRNATSDDYFLAGRSMSWPFVGGSLFASNISTTTLVGLAGAAYTFGIVFYNYEWMAAVVLAVFAVLFLRVVVRSRVYTMPEFLERRFSGAARTYLALLTLFLNIVVDTAGSLYAGALIFALVFPGVELWVIVAALAVAAGIYTIAGGLAAVMVTDAIQAVILVAASVVLTVLAFDAAGGWTAVVAAVSATAPEKLSLIRPMDDTAMPWPSLILGVPILGFYFWCTNQFMIQRVLAARDADHGRWGVLFAGFLKIPTLFIMVLPGTAAIVLYPDLDNGDTVYARLMFDLLPAGVLGLALAGFVAALMSQIDSTLNSASTLVTMDFVRRFVPELTEAQLMRTGQVATFLFMLLAVAWAPQIEAFPSLFQYLQDVLAYAVGPVVALFVVGVLWGRANAAGAHTAIAIGSLMSVGLFAAKVAGVFTLNNLYAAPITFVAACMGLVAGSLATAPPDLDRVAPYLWTRAEFDQETRELADRHWWTNYRWQSAGLLLLTAGVVWAWA